MRLLLSLCLSMLSLFLFTAPVTKAGTPASITNTSTITQPTIQTGVISTVINATDGASTATTPITHVSTQTERTHAQSPTTKRGRPITTTHTPKTTNKSQQKSNASTVVALLLFILVLIILLVIAFRWYTRNPDRRSFRGLRDSLVETAQLAWTTIMGCLQRPRKQEEDDEEVVEMEAGGGGEHMEEDANEDDVENKRQEEEDSDSDDSMEEYSIVDASNLPKENEKGGGQEEEDRRSAKEETEDMTTVTLEEAEEDEEEEEEAEPVEVDDLTPL